VRVAACGSTACPTASPIRVLSAADGERIVRHVGAEVHPRSPRVSAELPETGERFEGVLPVCTENLSAAIVVMRSA
jgi:Flp pilus assembly CpaF family ATPase